MFLRLLALFTFIPLIELMLLIRLGREIGLSSTLAIVFLTGILGAYLARQEGFIVITNIKQELSQGKIPAAHLLDGVIILAGGLLLLTPGLVTDFFGFLALIPATRNLIKNYLKRKFKQKIDNKKIYTSYTIEN